MYSSLTSGHNDFKLYNFGDLVSLRKEIMKSYITSKNEEKFRNFYVFEYFMWAFFVIHEGQVCLF